MLISELRLSYKMRRSHTSCTTSMLSSCTRWFSSHITMVLCWNMYLMEHSMTSYSKL